MGMARESETRLSKKQLTNLQESVRDFLTWLLGKLDPLPSNKYDSFVFVQPDAADWFMNVPGDGAPVQFNTAALKHCSYDYYRMIVLHECFHLLTQDVPNKLDAKRLKDDFGEPMMVLLDTEADFYTYLFHREVLGFSLSRYLSTAFAGVGTFADKTIRFPKFERFIGTQLSIFNHYLNGRGRDRDIYLASIKNVATESAVHLLISKGTHFQCTQATVGADDLKAVQALYKPSGAVTAYHYAEGIAKFCSQVLGIPIPSKLTDELRTLEGASQW